MSDALRLYGLKAVVSGAGSGIGEAIARTLIKHGAEVLALDSAASAIDSQFGSVRGITGRSIDLYAADAGRKMIEQVKADLGALDILVVNQDWQTDTPLAADDDEAVTQLMDRMHTQIRALVDVSIPLLKVSPAGRIICVGCTRSVFARDASAAAERVRAALAELMAGMAAETGKHSITANFIQPGAVMTPGSRRVYSADKELRDFCIGSSAAKRLGEPIDIAKVALFLATDDSVFVSGTGIAVDGGVLPDSAS